MKALLVNLYNMPGFNLGLAYVASSAKERHGVKVLDVVFHQKDLQGYLAAGLAQEAPDVVGFSVQPSNLPLCLEAARQIKYRHPRAKVMLGGIYPTLAPADAIAHPLVDAICIGEGERSFVEYLDRLQEDKVPDVPGIWYKDSNGAVHRNSLRPFEEDLDSLAFPDWDQWEADRYISAGGFFIGELRFLSSRGCIGNCTFCCNPAMRKSQPGRFFRLRSPRNVVEEIRHCQQRYGKRGFRVAGFADESFGTDIKWMEEFCDLYIKEGLSRKIKWACQTRIDVITSRWAGLAASAGCIFVNTGIESGDDYVRNEIYRKNVSREQIWGADRALRKHHIPYSVNVIVGCPTETKESIRNTKRLLARIRPLQAYYAFYMPLPYTELAASVTQEMLLEKDIFNPRATPKIRTTGLSGGDLQWAMLGFRMEKVARYLRWGLKFRPFGFVLDIFRYVFSGENKRVLFFRYPGSMHNLERHVLRLIYSYLTTSKLRREGQDERVAS